MGLNVEKILKKFKFVVLIKNHFIVQANLTQTVPNIAIIFIKGLCHFDRGEQTTALKVRKS